MVKQTQTHLNTITLSVFDHFVSLALKGLNSNITEIGTRSMEVVLVSLFLTYTVHKMKFSSKDFFNKCDQIHSFLRIWSYLLKKSLMINFIFCAVSEQVFGNWDAWNALRGKCKVNVRSLFEVVKNANVATSLTSCISLYC